MWMAEQELVPGPRLLAEARHAARSTRPSTRPNMQLNVNTQEHLAAKTLGLNAIGVVEVTTDDPIPFEPYARRAGRSAASS